MARTIRGDWWRGLLTQREWSRGTMGRCHRLDPGSSPGSRTSFFALITGTRPSHLNLSSNTIHITEHNQLNFYQTGANYHKHY